MPNPTLSIIVGEPILMLCPVRNGAARLHTLAVEWTGSTFEMRGRLRCTCCADPPRVRRRINKETRQEEWVLAET